MQEEEEDSKPLGICHKLFNLLLSRLVGFLRKASGHPLPQAPAEVPIGFKNGGHKKGGSSTVTSNAAQLQEGSESVPVKNQRNELPSVRDIAISNGKTSADQLPDKGPAMVKPIPTKEGKASGTAGKVTLPIEEGNKKGRPRPSVPPFTNINKKSGDFIQQMKEQMQRTDSMEPK